ncbi:MAG: hypothetical protein GY869_08325, partial [Planctomycetes bacterium]|nr:hypothetical protein [Planctomycetota bacterium]
LVNSILYNDSPLEIYFSANSDPNSVTIAYSDLMDGEDGIVTNGNGTVNWLDGNIDQDPLFVDPGNDDYHLQPGSPCIDAGNPDPQYNDGCLPPGLGTEMNDMGAYGGPGNCGWLPPGMITGTVDLVGTDDESGVMIFAQEIPGPHVLTAMDGYYELTLPPGTYTIVARKLGYQYGYAYNVVVEFDQITADVNFILDFAGPAPANLTAESNVYYQIPLSWEAPSPDPAYYRVYRRESSDEDYTLIADAINSANYNDDTVLEYTTYFYAVTAFYDNPEGESFYSNEVSATAINAPPPANLTAESDVYYQVPLTWEAPTPEPAYYRVYRRDNPGEDYTLIADDITEINYNDDDVQEYQPHYYVVTAVSLDPNGESFYSNEVSATAINAPPPANLTAESGLPDHIPLAWQAPDPEPAYYRLYRRENPDDDYTLLVESVFNLEYSDTEIQEYVTYYYVVTAVSLDPDGESFYSNEAIGYAGVVESIPFITDFESGASGFYGVVVNGSESGSWAYGQPDPNHGPGEAASGGYLWATGLDQNYGGNADYHLMSLAFDLTTVSETWLTFTHWYKFEAILNQGLDGGNVAVSTNAGNDWIVVNPEGGYDDQGILGLDWEPGYTDSSDGWLQAVFNLSEYVGHHLLLRFRVGANIGTNYAGWFIDDVALTPSLSIENEEIAMPLNTELYQ